MCAPTAALRMFVAYMIVSSVSYDISNMSGEYEEISTVPMHGNIVVDDGSSKSPNPEWFLDEKYQEHWAKRIDDVLFQTRVQDEHQEEHGEYKGYRKKTVEALGTVWEVLFQDVEIAENLTVPAILNFFLEILVDYWTWRLFWSKLLKKVIGFWTAKKKETAKEKVPKDEESPHKDYCTRTSPNSNGYFGHYEIPYRYKEEHSFMDEEMERAFLEFCRQEDDDETERDFLEFCRQEDGSETEMGSGDFCCQEDDEEITMSFFQLQRDSPHSSSDFNLRTFTLFRFQRLKMSTRRRNNGTSHVRLSRETRKTASAFTAPH